MNTSRFFKLYTFILITFLNKKFVIQTCQHNSFYFYKYFTRKYLEKVKKTERSSVIDNRNSTASEWMSSECTTKALDSSLKKPPQT